jgi:hypothetical protein
VLLANHSVAGCAAPSAYSIYASVRFSTAPCASPKCEAWVTYTIRVDSLQEILGQKNFIPPNDMQALREYVLRRYKANSYVKLQRDAIILSVSSSALAATLQLERDRIIEACNLSKKLVIRTGRQ